MHEDYSEQVRGMLRCIGWHDCTVAEAAHRLNLYECPAPDGTAWDEDTLRAYVALHGIQPGIPDLSHFAAPPIVTEWNPRTILRCVERGWRRDQAALRQAIRRNDKVRDMVVDLTQGFAAHPYQPDVYEFWYNYAQYFRTP